MDFFVSKPKAFSADAAKDAKEPSASGQKAGLPEISGQLDKINDLMAEAKKGLTSHLLTCQGSDKSGGVSVDQIKALLLPLQERLDGIGMLLDSRSGLGLGSGIGISAATGSGAGSASGAGSSAAAGSAGKPDTGVQALFDCQNQALSNAFDSLDKKIEGAVEYLLKNIGQQSGVSAAVKSDVPPSAAPSISEPKPTTPPVADSAPVPPSPAPIQRPSSLNSVSNDALMRAFLGDELCVTPSTAQACRKLLDGFLAHDKSASGLLGMMLQFHSAAPDKMPMLLKDIGEAYYRWQPKQQEDLPFERELARYLCGCCDAVGIKNSIELVSIGSRFDSTCHNATARGVVVTNVRGWIVLRDNGKVYTRATVDVQ